MFFQYYGYDRPLREFNRLYKIVDPSAQIPPYSSISSGKIRWVFYDSKSKIIAWSMPLDTYRYYVSMAKPLEKQTLSSPRGTIWTYDVRPYIYPSFFKLVIETLTYGRVDREFAREVVNVKNQFVIYAGGLGQAPFQFPAETLTEGRGKCADTSILLASMLIEGNRKAGYNFRVYVWYVQRLGSSLVSDSQSLTEVNHAMIQVEFSNGETWAIETTTNNFFLYSQPFTGWKFEVTTITR
jgi:hypothetical protein